MAGPAGYGIDPEAAGLIAERIREIKQLGGEVAVVIGGGNLWRGAGVGGMDRATADQMGMLATVMNALALQGALESIGVAVRVHTAIEMAAVAEPYIRRRAMHQLAKGYVVVLGAGTGNPFFTTDTAAALRATELGADVLIKATKVDGAYDADPRRDAGARRFRRLSFTHALALGLRVMDLTAFTLCQENDMPIIVLDFWAPGAIVAALRGEPVGTLISGGDGPAAYDDPTAAAPAAARLEQERLS